MDVRDIEIWRDGGTITFTLDSSGCAASYRLRTPFAGDPRLLYCDERELVPGGDDEVTVLSELRTWYASQLDPQRQAALDRLDGMPIWQNLSADLIAAAPLHRLRTVIRCLEARAA